MEDLFTLHLPLGNILFFALAMGTLLCQFHGLHLVFHCMVWRLESFEGVWTLGMN
jgi:hypothetical protein